MKNNKTRRIVFLSLLLAIAIVVNYLESLIPSIGIPGVRLGLTNIVIMIILYNFSITEATLITILRVFVVGLLRGTLFSIPFFMSLSGAILSILMMAILKNAKIFTEIGVSIGGAFMHSVGQIIVAIIAMDSIGLIYYLPVLIMLSVPTGIFVGLVARKIISLDLFKKTFTKE